jgi:hypothetical protein
MPKPIDRGQFCSSSSHLRWESRRLSTPARCRRSHDDRAANYSDRQSALVGDSGAKTGRRAKLENSGSGDTEVSGLATDSGHEVPTASLPSLLTSTMGAPAAALRWIEGSRMRAPLPRGLAAAR